MLAATGNLSRIFRRLTVRAAILTLVASRTAAALVRAFVLIITHFVSLSIEAITPVTCV